MRPTQDSVADTLWELLETFDCEVQCLHPPARVPTGAAEPCQGI